MSKTMGKTEKLLLSRLEETGMTGLTNVRMLNAARKLHSKGLARFVNTSEFVSVYRNGYSRVEFSYQGRLLAN